MAMKAEDLWHANRAKNIGASEVAALFDVHPYLTRFQLWHLKKGTVASPDFDNERMKWGIRLESAIAKGIAEDYGWTIRNVRRYITHPTIQGMGASLDFEVFGHPDGPGCFEIKNVDRTVFNAKWLNGDKVEAPLHYELQLQHQLAVTGRSWGALGVLAGGNESHLLRRERHDGVIQKIEAAVVDFWRSIREELEPKPYDASDYKTVCQLFGKEVPGKEIDLTKEQRAFELCCVIQESGKAKKKAEQDGKAAKAELLQLIGDAESATCENFKITARTVAKDAYTVEASSYRDLRVKQLKKGE